MLSLITPRSLKAARSWHRTIAFPGIFGNQACDATCTDAGSRIFLKARDNAIRDRARHGPHPSVSRKLVTNSTVATQRSHAVSQTGVSAAIACLETAFVFYFRIQNGGSLRASKSGDQPHNNRTTRSGTRVYNQNERLQVHSRAG
jgi:hypothetical protein